ncbi:hypothetical protein ABK040_012924 [Willaertia magna]
MQQMQATAVSQEEEYLEEEDIQIASLLEQIEKEEGGEEVEQIANEETEPTKSLTMLEVEEISQQQFEEEIQDEEELTTNNEIELKTNTSSDDYQINIHKQTIISILSDLYESGYYPPNPLAVSFNEQIIYLPFPTLEHLTKTFLDLKILYLYEFLYHSLHQSTSFKNHLLITLQKYNNNIILQQIDIICHDIVQQILIRPIQTISLKKNKCLSFGDYLLDNLFSPNYKYGIPIRNDNGGFIIELSGSAGCGKTQICLQLSLQCILNEIFGGLNSKVLYLYSEGFPMDRYLEMINSKIRQINNYDKINHSNYSNIYKKEYFLNQMIQKEIKSTEELSKLLIERNLNNFTMIENELDKKNIKLLIIDSLGYLMRESHGNLDQAKDRAQLFIEYINEMKYLCTKYGIIIIVINQVTNLFEKDFNFTFNNFNNNGQEALNYYLYQSHFDDNEEELNDLDSYYYNVMRSTQSYYQLCKSERSKPSLGLTWSTLIDIRLFLTKVNQKTFFSDSLEVMNEKKRKLNDKEEEIVYLRKLYEDQLPNNESEETRQLHVIYSPFSAQKSCNFKIDTFGVKGI